jgi:DNA-binding LacI/PurR family transcriptional regulator
MARSFGSIVRDYREDLGWTQGALAKSAGLAGPSIVSRAEGARVPPPPTPEVARRIIAALHQELRFTHAQLHELTDAYLLTGQLTGASEQSWVIAVAAPNVEANQSSFWSAVVGAIQAHASLDHQVVALFQHDDDTDAELRALSAVAETPSLYGLILAPAMGANWHSGAESKGLASILGSLQKRGIPTVLIDRKIPIDEKHDEKHRDLSHLPYVGVDNEEYAERAVRRLIKAGHTRIGALLDLPHNNNQRKRLAGYQAALTHYGLSYDQGLVKWGQEDPLSLRGHYRQLFGFHRGRLHTEELLDTQEDGERPTAIFCGTYRLAIDALAVARARQLAVPDQLSLVGLDGVHELGLTTPPISHVSYPITEMGGLAVKKLRILKENPGDAAGREDRIIRSFEEITGGSIGPP